MYGGFDNAAQKFQIAWLYLILNLHKSLDVNCEKRQVETLTVRFHQSQYIWESQERHYSPEFWQVVNKFNFSLWV